MLNWLNGQKRGGRIDMKQQTGTSTGFVNENKITQVEVTHAQKALSFFGRYGLLVLMIALFIVFGAVEPYFKRMSNILDIFRTASIYGICALGLAMVMISGEIDFACSLEMALGGVAIALILDSDSFHSYPLAVVLVLLIAAAVGAINWFLHCQIGIPAFIATMGTSLTIKGILMGLTKSARVFSTKWPANFKTLGSGRLFDVIPYPAICFLVIAVVMLLYTERTSSGKKLYAVGSNSNACKYVGIKEKHEKLKAFILCSCLAAFAGIIHCSTNGGAIYSLGDNALINGMTILMLGATFYRVGVFNVPGCIVGAIIISALDNGLTMIGAGTVEKHLVKGIVLLGSVFLVTMLRRSSASSKKKS